MYGISNSQQQGGGGGGAASITYTKLSGDVEFSSTRPSASSAFFVNTDVANWAVNETMGRKTLTSTSDLGLVIGNSYTMDVNIDGTSYTFSGTATDMGFSGMKLMSLRNESKGGFVIYDHCDFSAGYPQADNGAIILSALSPSPTSATITDFSGELQIVSPATITNSAIKTNSSVTMYINSDITVRGTKTDGSITLNASEGGYVSYEMEILDVPTEGLFEIINGYVPTIPEITLPQWHTIFESATPVVSAEIGNNKIQPGQLYRITVDMSGEANPDNYDMYIASSPGDYYIPFSQVDVSGSSPSSVSVTAFRIEYTSGNSGVIHLSPCALYDVTAEGIKNFDAWSNASTQDWKFTKLEVYR